MSVNKDDIRDMFERGGRRVRKAAIDTKDTVKEKYRLFKVGAELDDLYIELGMLVNRAYNKPGTVSESEVAALNEKINKKILEKGEK